MLLSILPWRCELAGSAMKWRPGLAPKRTQHAAPGNASAAELVTREATPVYTSASPPAADRATQLRHRLGARIRTLRAARGLTQEIIADRIEVTPKYVSQLECGQRSPSWETLVAIAHHGFEIRLAALMFGIDEDVAAEVQDVNDMLAGRPKETRRDLLQAMELMLRAGAGPK
jgi:transcriptional regulator with XRE-family HTH domain